MAETPMSYLQFFGAKVDRLFVRLLSEAEHRTLKIARSTPTKLVILLLPFLLLGCGDSVQSSDGEHGGDQARGAELIKQSGCGACHVVPGIEGATGLVGPPLNQIGVRVYIAGVLRNTPDNMIKWLRNPQAVVPGNAMPDMGLDEHQASDIAAYLSTLQ
jgi:putative membrane protein